MAEQGVLKFTKEIAFPAELVWAAITDSNALAKWWATGDIRPVVGHEFSLDMGPFGAQACKVLEVVPEKLFVMLFGIGSLDTTITFRLEESDGHTVLNFEQSGFDLDSPMGAQAYEGMGRGWPGILARIEPAIAGA